MDASSRRTVAAKEGYQRRLRSALARSGELLYDVGHMSGRVQFAGFYFYAYLGPARDRLGVGQRPPPRRPRSPPSSYHKQLTWRAQEANKHGGWRHSRRDDH